MAVHHCIRADLHHCTCCGARPEVLDQVLARCGPVGIAVVSCLPCRNADPDRAYMRAVLEARYDAGRFGNNTKGDVDAPTDRR
jgi:hypothetical protein